MADCAGNGPDGNALKECLGDKPVPEVMEGSSTVRAFPHSYMAFGPLALSMMLDHKCVINPYSVYVHNDHWTNEELREEAKRHIRKPMDADTKRELREREKSTPSM